MIRKFLSTFYHYILYKKFYPLLYKKYARKPINKNKIVFIEGSYPYITNSSKLLYDTLKNNSNYEIHTHFLQTGFLPRKEYLKVCINMVKDIADAKYVFINEACIITSCFTMRKETIFTQLWHGCGAFKKFGFNLAGKLVCPDPKILQLYHKNYTHVTVSSPEVIWAYEEAMNLKKGIVKAVGCSRTDIFFDSSFKEKAYKNIYEYFPQAKGKKIILYAPTFRETVKEAKTPTLLNISQFQEALQDEYVLMLKYHPLCHQRPTIADNAQNFAIDCSTTMSIEDLIFVSDLCISDYSSLIFEYSLFERPMIFFAYDLEEYSQWYGFYYNYKSFVPGPIYSTNEEIIEYIKNIDTQFNKQQVLDFKNKFMSSCDGHSTKRIIDLVFQKS